MQKSILILSIISLAYLSACNNKPTDTKNDINNDTLTLNSTLVDDTIKNVSAKQTDLVGEWILVPSPRAIDIATYSDDLTFIIEMNTRIHKWNKLDNTWVRFPDLIDGRISSIERISVSQDNLWIIAGGSKKNIYKWEGNNWAHKLGAAYDIGVGSGNNVWIIADNNRPYKWNGTEWDIKPGAGIRISVDENDVPCMVGTDKNVYFWKDNAWELSRAGAIDIGSGGNQTWHIGDNFVPHQLVENNWRIINGITAIAIDVNHLGTPWIVGTHNLNKQVYRRK